MRLPSIATRHRRRVRSSLVLVLLAGGCRYQPADPGTAPGTGDSGIPSDTGPPTGTSVPTRYALPATCVVADNGVPALVRRGADAHNTPPQFMELVDVELDGDVAWAAGQGGYIPVDVRDPAAPRVLFLDGNFISRLHRVESVRPGLLAGSNRDEGLTLLDVNDPAAPVIVGVARGTGWEGLAAVGDLLYVSSREEGLLVFDVADAAHPRELAAVPGLPSTWELVATDDGWLYAADNDLGIVPVDLADPTAPVVGAPVAMPGATYHVAVQDGYVYAAVGGDGVVVLDRSDPARPVPVAQVTTGGTVVMVAISGRWLYAADHEGVQVVDVSDPAHPVPWSHVETDMFALAVAADDTLAYVGDWGVFETWELDPDRRAPSLSVPSTSLTRVAGVARAAVTNRGAGTLTFSGAVASDGSVVEVGATSLESGEETWLEVGGSGPIEVCLASSDPVSPTLTLKVDDGGDPPVGIVAPDFTLEDLDGTVRRLADHVGDPVFITFFATW